MLPVELWPSWGTRHALCWSESRSEVAMPSRRRRSPHKYCSLEMMAARARRDLLAKDRKTG